MNGEIYPELRVGMRRVNLTPTVTIENGEKRMEENAPVYVYDTSGPYSDPKVEIDLEKGLPKLRNRGLRRARRARLRWLSPSAE